MRKIIVAMFLSLFCFLSCGKDKKITLQDVIGTYEYIYHDADPKWDLMKHIIELKPDMKFTHQIYHMDTLLVNESGIYEFDGFIPPYIYIYEFTAFIKHMYDTPKKTNEFLFIPRRTLFGSIYLTFNWGIDPDGAPQKPIFKKIK